MFNGIFDFLYVQDEDQTLRLFPGGGLRLEDLLFRTNKAYQTLDLLGTFVS